MKSTAIFGCGLLVTVMVFTACATRAASAQEEQKIKAKALPAAISEAFHKAYPQALMRGISREVEGGKTFYEVESVDGKTRRDLLYAPDGTCIEIEESVPAKTLPLEVLESVKKGFPNGKIVKSEKLIKGETVQYELLVRTAKERYEVLLDQKGAIVKDTKAVAKSRDDQKETNEKK
jgi:hypothetical protein